MSLTIKILTYAKEVCKTAVDVGQLHVENIERRNMEDYFEEDRPLDQVTLKELDELALKIAAQKKVIDGLEDQLKAANLLQGRYQIRMIAILERFNKSSYTTSGVTLVRSERRAVTLPQTPEAKEEFYAYLKERNIFEDLISVNSTTLNVFYKREHEIAVKEERSIGFKIPGIEEPKTHVTLQIRKSR